MTTLRWMVTSAAIAAVVTGCATTSSVSRPKRPSLTEATEEAKKPAGRQKPIVVNEDEEDEDEPDVVVVHVHEGHDPGNSMDSPDGDGDTRAASGGAAIQSEESTSLGYASATLGFDTQGGPQLHGVLLGGAEAGIRGRRYRAGLGVRIGRPDVVPGSAIARATTRVGELLLDGCVRGYLTHDHTFMGVYGLAGARVGLVTWTYANPVTVIEGDERTTVTTDALLTVQPYVGLGLSIAQVSGVHIGGNVSTGVKLYSDETIERFQNDLFSPVGFVSTGLEISYLF